MPQARDQRCDLLHVAIEMRRDGRLDAEGTAGKKLVTPGLRRDAVAWAIRAKDYSQRRACRLIGMDPKTWRYASRRPDDAECGGGCANWLRSDGDLAIGACISCSTGRGWQ